MIIHDTHELLNELNNLLSAPTVDKNLKEEVIAQLNQLGIKLGLLIPLPARRKKLSSQDMMTPEAQQAFEEFTAWVVTKFPSLKRYV